MAYSREQFIKKYWQAFVNATSGTGIFPEVMAAQAILESSRKSSDGNYYVGLSELTQKANNYFGIKDSAGWTGPTYNISTKEYSNGVTHNETDAFRAYGSPEESFADYVKFLQSNPRYASAGVFTASTPAEQSQRLQAAGYATDPNYSTLLQSVMIGFKKYIPTIAEGGGIALLLFFLYLTYKHYE